MPKTDLTAIQKLPLHTTKFHSLRTVFIQLVQQFQVLQMEEEMQFLLERLEKQKATSSAKIKNLAAVVQDLQGM